MDDVQTHSLEKFKIMETAFKGVFIIIPIVHTDERGYFLNSFEHSELNKYGLPVFVQHSQSFSRQGVLRGLHFQRQPHAQAKLVRVLKGIIWDVVVDIRSNSPTYGKHIAQELSDTNFRQLYIPEGFAHGFSVLSENAIVSYHLHKPYHPQFESGIRYNDPQLGIDWKVSKPLLSEKDQNLPLLKNIEGFE